MLVSLIAACATLPAANWWAPPASSLLAGITGEHIRRHVEVLASDAFEGRAPGTRGEELTVEYLTAEFHRMGLLPGNPDGTYAQDVPMIGIASVPQASFCVSGQCAEWAFSRDYVGGSLFLQPEVVVEASELVFVGYGLIAPESHRDDYKDYDVRGKTLLMFAADPDPAAMAISGGMSNGGIAAGALSLSRKREAAVAKGAAARVLIHENGDPIGPLSSYAWNREELEVRERRAKHLPVSLVAGEAKVRELLARAGHDFDRLKAAALRNDFRPIALGATAHFHVTNRLRSMVSRNVVARIAGSDPELRDEHVIHVAHWDHLGRDPSREGDPVYHGALDNASGVAALLEIARAYSKLPTPPKRSVLFIATTGEEQGLLGARHYVANPLHPISRAVAAINLDALNPWGPTRDFEVVGYGESTLDRVLARAAQSQGKAVTADGRPELGFYYRSDQVEFARAGVPSVWIRRGSDYIGKPRGYGRERNAAYFSADYHQVSDVPKPDWDYGGMAEQVRFAFEVGYRLAQGAPRPEWRPDLGVRTGSGG